MPNKLPGVPLRLTDPMITLCHLAGAKHALEHPEDVQEVNDALALLPPYVGVQERRNSRRFSMSRARAKRKGLPDPFPNEKARSAPAKSGMYRFPPSAVPALIKLFRLAEDIPSNSLEQIASALGGRANQLEQLDTITLLGMAAG